MPRGRPRKAEKEEKKDVIVSTENGAEPAKPSEPEVRPLEKLQPGFKWFEAPDGTLYQGEANKRRIFVNGMFVNAKR
jgi:hypothetical protein